MKVEGVSLNGDNPLEKKLNSPQRIVSNNKKNFYTKTKNCNINKKNNRYCCEKCGLLINSIESLRVHMQYQHEEMSRWSVPSSVPPTGSSSVSSSGLSTSSITTGCSTNVSSIHHNTDGGSGGSGLITNITNPSSKSPTDQENNNHTSTKHQTSLHHSQQSYNNKQETSSHSHSNNTNNTISAAADSSDNQPSTPQPSVGNSGGTANEISHNYNSNNTNSPYQHGPHNNNVIGQEMHPYPSYMHSYDQFYHPPPGMDYSQSPLYPGGNQASAPPHQEYKLVPSSRYHPYLNNSNHLQHQQQQQQMQPHHTNASNTNGSNTSSSTTSNSSLSPRVVSSSSPTQNSLLGQTGQDASTIPHVSQGQPTPSPSPKQCDKCGLVCQTDAQLSEHYNVAHGVPQNNDTINRNSSATDDGDMTTQYPYQTYVKEEPSSDILDLDSQKMVYPPPHEPVGQEPLPPMHSVHPMHRPIMWGTDMHSGYMPHGQTDLKQPYYSPVKQPYPPIKQEYVSIKQEYPTAAGFGGQMLKSDFSAHHQTIAPQTRPDIKPFSGDINSATNPVSSSPSEFPSTTTPQDNGPPFRGFEPPTSSLSNSGSGVKSTTWKSNEARRPKTYNCTACNKWFTSSGHLKRHYNTTLHKNAVKSSGQPDPATMPISVHHHPSRDPNSKHHRTNPSQQPPPAPPEPPRSPEYTPQYTPPPGGFVQPPQSFQHYNSSLHAASNGHPNGQAGPSVHASQPRGLLIISTTEATSNLDQEEQVQHNQQQEREEQYHQQQILEDQLNHRQERRQQQLRQQDHIISMSPHHHQQHQDIICTTPTTTTIHNSMDQQQYIISPLAINTTNIIPSFHSPAEHLPSYHTIIGNDSQIINSNTENLLQLGSFDMSVPQNGHHSLQLTALHHIQTTTDGQQVSTLTALNPSSIAELHRLSGGVATYQENTALPFSPVVPESILRSVVPSSCEKSPQEADVAPPQSSQTATTPTMSSFIFQYSPPIASSKTIPPTTQLQQLNSNRTQQQQQQSIIIIDEQENQGNQLPQQPKKSSAKRKRNISISTPTNLENSSSTEPPKKIECIECGKEFAKSCYLTQHNKTFHSGEQPYRCPKCGKRFQSVETYDIHIEKHKAKDKPFKCDTCPKQFHHKTDLRRHRDGHTGYKAHVCDTCSKGFCRKDHLRKHSDTHKPKPLKKKIIEVKSQISV